MPNGAISEDANVDATEALRLIWNEAIEECCKQLQFFESTNEMRTALRNLKK